MSNGLLHGKVISHRIPPCFPVKAQILTQKQKPTDNTWFLNVFHKYLKNNHNLQPTIFKPLAENTTL